jgi:hypothetical protein
MGMGIDRFVSQSGRVCSLESVALVLANRSFGMRFGSVLNSVAVLRELRPFLFSDISQEVRWFRLSAHTA